MEKKLIPIFIFLIGLFIRLYALYFVYLPLNWDEVSHGFNAYSILKTFRDEWGQLLPLANFRAYGDYPLPLYMYLTIPFIAIFGLTENVIRMPSLIFGSLTVLGTYYLAKTVSKSERIGIISALVLAFSPWHIHQSRAVFQSTIAVFFIVWGVYFFLSAKKKSIRATLGIALLGLSLYSYHNARIFIPPFVLLLFIQFKEKVLNRYSVLNEIIFIVLFIPIVFILLSPTGQARSKWVGLINEGAINEINTQRTSSNLPALLARLRYNKGTYFVEKSTLNYFTYFSPRFLFLEGGTQYQFSLPGKGIMYPSEMLFFYIGLILAIGLALKNNNYRTLVIWLLLAPIPAAITQGSQHVIRASTMIPVPHIFTALGIFYVYEKIANKSLAKALFVMFFMSEVVFIGSWLYKYSTDYIKNYSWSWQYGYKETIGYIKKNYDKYDHFIITKKFGEPHEFLLFYWPWDPKSYQSDKNLIRFYQSNWYWVDRFDKFTFVNDWDIPLTGNHFIMESKGILDCSNSTCLLITSPGKAPGGWKRVNTIYYPNNDIAFEMYEKQN